uniref:Uncharacterized protein n=1 Tax=Anguilla anguilla TaxID=7936 RepID=A0A0E9PZC3_ANGAN
MNYNNSNGNDDEITINLLLIWQIIIKEELPGMIKVSCLKNCRQIRVFNHSKKKILKQ